MRTNRSIDGAATVGQRARPWLLSACLLGLASPSSAAEVVADDLVVKGSACIGSACDEDEVFPFDSLRIQGSEPRLTIIDDSGDSSPSNDWSLGITDDGMGGPSEFFIQDDTHLVRVLLLTVEGTVALGAGAEPVQGAVSVGAMGNERRVMHVADAVDDTDAVNLRQFEAFQARALTSVGGDADKLNQQLDDMRTRLDKLTTRVEKLAARMQ